MYHANFGLERGLFDEGIAADAAVFRTPKHDQLIANFKLALASPSSGIVLHGPAGAGKTTLTSTALRASTTRLAVAWVNGMATNAAELLELILVELGINTLRTTRIERLQLWRQFQGEMRATDSRLFIVVERTEDLSPEVLHALDQLTAADAVGNPGANLVLLGHAGIAEHLAAPVLDSLRQRIRLRAELEPFTEAELQDYLRHQVACAGGHYDRVFAPGAVGALFRYSQGIARLANTLCDSALDFAAAQQQKQLTAELIAKTATSLLGLAEPLPATRPAATAPRVESAPSVESRRAPRPLAAGTPAAERSPERPVTAAPMPPAAAPTVTARPVPPPSSPAPAPIARAPTTVDVEYDGSATDIADVALADFPILTDAVEAPLPAPVAKQSTPAPAKAPAAAAPSAKPASRLEAFYAASRPTQKPPASPAATAPTASAAPPPAAAPTPRAAPAKPEAPPAHAAAPRDSEDALRQTQTMRAISAAKSIDDISEVDAETLFGDAELDLVSAALAAEWPDEDDFSTPGAVSPPAQPAAAKAAPPAAKTAPPAAKAAPAAAKAAPQDDDPFDLFGLGDDAPLELIDDSSQPNDRKSAAR